MQKLMIQTKHSTYPIYVGDCLASLNPFIQKASQVVVITDQTVYDLHYAQLKEYLPSESPVFVIKPGESSKSISNYYEIQTFLIEHQVDRRGLVLAFGGGVVGDLAGFVSATYMRGIDFIQIPTTLLAHDSAIGGKVAINHELGKNLIGAFYPPLAVIYHLDFLKTLSDKEWRSGFAEMLKHGFIANDDLLTKLMSYPSLEPLKHPSFSPILIDSLKVKQVIVEADEFEKGQRAFLNFGHTFGHAVELVYLSLSHGEAVAIGMAFALFVSQEKLFLQVDLMKYLNTLVKLNYPILLEEEKIETYLNYMDHDKKNDRQLIRFVLLDDKQSPCLVSLTREETKRYVKQFLKWMNDRRL
ncbi:3-dehydroquinate synthase [Turicibacter sanguinis]|uniref:3-dehydroquinate synthase n=1 Tax=Turicibacter sanguinis TaxID=154288 RepID=UPI0021D48F99|nr:3-dehydroquinate synthase [Turicibacter sanguinis]MCU7191659.1 3-dehydroquinate synthase [Turicibacter sanguinis]